MKAAVALGANLGDREASLRDAVHRLGALGEVVAVSSFFDTEPVGYVDQPPFLNGACVVETSLTPLALLRGLLAIEVEMGRDRSHGIAKGPRVIDLDLLLYEDLTMASAELTLPHPEMAGRRFVLEPLAEVAGDWFVPRTDATVGELLQRLLPNA
ncbi:2-amino-4-hydroxy-6-hydroxymethyldihydropteridine diphosphokinase [Terriglobus saanensis]|uniref:2-amino-4-hydroxy-6-hydroxymethyldihydropteridine pyrophosphokinase n=1 Tax=Terriglobus saanensis (strain ATCC BAA-1853 / DSM 23119 / SP1PR4) TaxID=401053 RepID=E8V3T5_TERSS|nr:2-amino-4-hydroxy-6-hydroxymethyldihydropteridine diphosphokinase [Terriglobus saanensis]ADV84772.1 2-amino-4-hydroxy-6-hydroxymethyldihydropteridine pyrophosphokinase [Terriglobus saanensis SP1PR4]